MPSLQRRSVRKTAVVGGSVVLDCGLPLDHQQQQDLSATPLLFEIPQSSLSPTEVSELEPVIEDPNPLQQRQGTGHMIKWHKQGIEV